MNKKNKIDYAKLLWGFSFILLIVGWVFYNFLKEELFFPYLFFGLGFFSIIASSFFRINNLKESFKRRSFQKGFSSIVSIILISGVFISFYILIRNHPLRIDMTEENRFSLSQKSIQILNKLKKSFVIKVLANESSIDNQTVELLKNYDNASSKITVEYISHLENPRIFKKYKIPYESGEGVGSLVIEQVIEENKINENNLNKNKYFVIFPRDLYKQSFNPQTNRPIKQYQGESKISSVLDNVEGFNKKNLIYYTKGHGEADFHDNGNKGLSQVKNAMLLEGYELKKINLLITELIPSNVKLLIIVGAKSPFQTIEIERIMTYINNGGSLLILNDPEVQGSKFSINKIIKNWKVKTDGNLIIENNPSYSGTLIGIGSLIKLHLPKYSNHSIVKNLKEKQLATAFVYSQSFSYKQSEIPKDIKIVNLLRTTENSWLEKGGRGNHFDKGIDIRGPLNLAIAITKNIELKNNIRFKDSDKNKSFKKEDKNKENSNKNINDNNKKKNNTIKKQARIVLIGDTDFIRNNFSSIGPFENNQDLFLNSIAWLTQQNKKITIRPKELKRRDLLVTAQGLNTIYYVTVIFIPLFIISIGIYVYQKRRKIGKLLV